MWAWVKLCCVLSSPSASLVCGFTNYSEEENASSKIIALHIGINQDFSWGKPINTKIESISASMMPMRFPSALSRLRDRMQGLGLDYSSHLFL